MKESHSQLMYDKMLEFLNQYQLAYIQLNRQTQILMQVEDNSNWLPLESNPEVMNQFVKKLGLKTQFFSVQDLLSTQDWAQQMLLKPVLGIVFLYQINNKQKQFFKQEAENLQNNKVSQNLFYMKQYAKNACGTIALFHVIVNAAKKYPHIIQENSYFSQFIQSTNGKSAQEIGELFKKSKDLQNTHKQSVKKGQTKVQQKVQTHFIAFIQKDGFLYQMDGGKKCPINHGECTEQGLAMMACLVIQQFMARDAENTKFTLLAVSATPY